MNEENEIDPVIKNETKLKQTKASAKSIRETFNSEKKKKLKINTEWQFFKVSTKKIFISNRCWKLENPNRPTLVN